MSEVAKILLKKEREFIKENVTPKEAVDKLTDKQVDEVFDIICRAKGYYNLKTV